MVYISDRVFLEVARLHGCMYMCLFLCVCRVHTLQDGGKLVSPKSTKHSNNSKSNFYLSSSLRRCCPGERHCSLVITISVGNSP